MRPCAFVYDETDGLAFVHGEIKVVDGLHDAAWCRWVAMFVPSVPTLVE